MKKIIITPEYYQGTYNAPQEGFAKKEDTNEILEWETEEEAQDWIDEKEKGIYYLSHGEAGRPSYRIVDEDEDLGEDCYDAEDCLGVTCHYGEIVDPGDVPAEIMEVLDIGDVQYRDSGDDYDIYTYKYRGYTVVYCPRTTAIDLNVDDLGGVDWANEAYYYEVD